MIIVSELAGKRIKKGRTRARPRKRNARKGDTRHGCAQAGAEPINRHPRSISTVCRIGIYVLAVALVLAALALSFPLVVEVLVSMNSSMVLPANLALVHASSFAGPRPAHSPRAAFQFLQKFWSKSILSLFLSLVGLRCRERERRRNDEDEPDGYGKGAAPVVPECPSMRPIMFAAAPVLPESVHGKMKCSFHHAVSKQCGLEKAAAAITKSHGHFGSKSPGRFRFACSRR